ncbi:hypothetical protein ANAEL_04286 [Anaerolineales bacterium]|nr:hypothetical protein ANAEL_04286 [Anaerolineales bacterium]
MKYRKLFPLVIFALLFNLVAACSPAAVSAPTETATVTPVPATPTKTPKPTATPKPSATPDIAATQKYDDFATLLEKSKNDGYISTTSGKITELEPFKEEWAQINWFQWWDYGTANSEFVLKATFDWSTSTSNPDESGCGVVFGLQENGDYYVVFLTNARVLFMLKRGSNLYNVGKTSGPGAYKFDNPAKAEFVLAVSDQKARVIVDGEPTLYTLSVDQTAAGGYGLSLLSGTNKDYGTRCEATDMMLWTAK